MRLIWTLVLLCLVFFMTPVFSYVSPINGASANESTTLTTEVDDPYVAGPDGTVRFALDHEPFTIVRQTNKGYERQIPLSFQNDGDDIPAGDIYVTSNEQTFRCPLESISKGECHDTVWVPSDASRLDFLLTKNGRVILKRRISLPKASDEKTVVIPLSRIIKNIPPLSIRGTNYLPRDHPWPGLFREATIQDFETDFTLMNTLSMNTMRTFVFYDPDPNGVSLGLYRKDGSATTLAQKRLSDLLNVADSHKIKVILCPGSLPPLDDIRSARRMFKTIFGPFVNDGRILMFDVMNEPGGASGPKANATLSTWLTTLYPYARRLLPNHLLTVGLAWQFNQLWELGIKPDVAQYHDYSGAVGRQPTGKPPVRNVYDDLRNTIKFVGSRPLLIGEFGHSTAGKALGAVDEERQREIYEGVLIGAEDQRIAGVANWTLFDFGPDWMGKTEQVFGIVRKDGSLKPSGELLKSTYARWRREHPAPWDDK